MTTLAIPAMPKATSITQPDAQGQDDSARPAPTTVPNGGRTKPRQEIPVPADELVVIQDLSGTDKWRLRGRILGYGRDAMPSAIWRGLTVRPADADIREMTESGQLDDALARALAWERSYTADLVSRSAPGSQAATPAAIARTIHTGAQRAYALSARQQEIVDRLLAERDAAPQAAYTPPPASQLGAVVVTAAELAAAAKARRAEETWVAPAQQAWRDKQAAAHAARASQKDGGTDGDKATTTTNATPAEPKRPSRTKKRGKRTAEAERILRLARAVDLEALRANSPENAEFVDAVLGLTVDELAGQANAWMSQTVSFLTELAA